MKAFPAIVEKVANRVAEVSAILLFGVVAITGAFSSAYLEDGYSMVILFPRDSLLLNVLFCGILFGTVILLTNMVARNMEKRRKWLLWFSVAYAFCLSLLWAAVSKHAPTADQASVYYASKHFAVGYFEAIAGKGSYFSCYPHQMGLALFYELLFRIFHTDSFHLLQGVNAICNAVSVLALYKITDLLFENKRVSVYLLFLMLLCFPLFWYTPFVYGELPSFAFSFFGLWMLLRAVRRSEEGEVLKEHREEGVSCKRKNRKELFFWILSLLSFVCAVAVRKNTLILMIAVALTLAIYIIKNRKYTWFIYLGLLLLVCSQVNSMIITSYEKRSGGKLLEGVPAISHVVMGLQESEIAPGWYNGFNFNTYTQEADYDHEEAVRLSRIAFTERLRELKSDAGDTFRFFWDKFRAEWQNAGYACFYCVASKYYTRWPLVENLFSGAGFHVMQFFMDKYQFFIYLMAFLFFLGGLGRFHRKHCEKTEAPAGEVRCGILRYTLLATVIGGALFYLVWEGNGRYILPYFLMTIPYAAAGMERVRKFVSALPALKNKKPIVE